MTKSKKRERQKGEPLDLVKIHADRALAEFLGRFDMDLLATPENVRMVTEQFQVITRMHAAMEEVTVVERGKRLIWLKTSVKHGEWLSLLERMNLGDRTARWYMAEARYVLEHGARRKRIAGQIGSATVFDEDEADEFDAADLADPSKPVPMPRKELEAELRRRNAQKAAWEKRDEALQKEVDFWKKRTADAEKTRDPDAVSDMNPIREAMVRAVLSAGRAVVVLREAETEDLVTELREGAIASLNSRLVTAAQDAANEIYKVFHKAFPGKPWKGPEPTDED